MSGIKTDITTISRGSDGAMVILVCFIATIGKFIGAGSMAWFSGMTFRESSVVAVLMNTRGLVELIVLNLGKDAGILNGLSVYFLFLCSLACLVDCGIELV